MRPRLLDLFCGAGGAGMGYHRAGFEVVGVDIEPQKRYPFESHQADALEYLREHGREFDAIHASPPCQAHSAMRTMPNAKRHESLIEPVRALLQETGRSYMVENVPGAPLRDPVILCGTMFGLRTDCGAQLRRHLLFELSWSIGLVPCCHHNARVCGVYGHTGGSSTRRMRTITVVGDGGGWSKMREGRAGGIDGRMFPLRDRRIAMGIDWMTGAELSQAIPPAYTEFIGRRLVAYLIGG